jgi:hypothetical protein
MLKKIWNLFLVTTGFILSPLSWWNDLIVNIPISYVLALPFGLINKQIFNIAFVAMYWLTNVVGILMMQFGAKGFSKKETPARNATHNVAGGKLTKKNLLTNLGFCSLYSVLIFVLVQFKIISFPG